LTRDSVSLALRACCARPNWLSFRFVEPSKGYGPLLVFKTIALPPRRRTSVARRRILLAAPYGFNR